MPGKHSPTELRLKPTAIHLEDEENGTQGKELDLPGIAASIRRQARDLNLAIPYVLLYP